MCEVPSSAPPSTRREGMNGRLSPRGGRRQEPRTNFSVRRLRSISQFAKSHIQGVYPSLAGTEKTHTLKTFTKSVDKSPVFYLAPLPAFDDASAWIGAAFTSGYCSSRAGAARPGRRTTAAAETPSRAPRA